MGSFQQITMGVICLVAAFWFGAHIQNRPVGQNQTAQLLPDGTIDPTRPSIGNNLLEKTKGFLTSMFESPVKEKPITVDDLRGRPQIGTPAVSPLNLLSQNQGTVTQQRDIGMQDHGSGLKAQGIGQALSHQSAPVNNSNLINDPNLVNENLLRLQGELNDPLVPQRMVGSFQSETETAPVQPAFSKVAIVPDFSSLAEEVNRGFSFNTPAPPQPVSDAESIELIPVPKFADFGSARPAAVVPETDWESVRKQVAAAESRLNDYRQQMTQPIPKIESSVTQRTQEFWNRQQTEARRSQPLQFAASAPTRVDRSLQFAGTEPAPVERPQSLRERRLNPETFDEKRKRWDVFTQDPSKTDGREYRQLPNYAATSQAASTQPTATQRQAHRQTQRQTRPSIVEVDRGFVSERPEFVRPRPQAAAKSPATVRSLNDDRFVGGETFGGETSPYVTSENNRVAFQPTPQSRPREIQNQLRPQYDPDPGSRPEFITPPDYGKYATQSAAPSSEIVEAAAVAYGSFREYETQPQDTLQMISEKFYGSADYYYDLYLANRDLLSNPATVPPGLTIKIPKFDGR